MPLLTIETSTPFEQVAVVDGGAALAERMLEGGRSRADELLDAVDSVLRSAGLTVHRLDGVVVSVGPGRFTGLRVGLATAKGLAAASGLPIFAASTLAALARSVGPAEGVVCPVLDARRGEVYGAVFDGESLDRLTEDRALPPSEFAELAAGVADGRQSRYVGTGVAYRAEILAAAGDAAAFADPAVAIPTPSALVSVADRSRPVDPASFEPVYIRGVTPPGGQAAGA